MRVTLTDTVLEALLVDGVRGTPSSELVEIGVRAPRSVIYRLRNNGYSIATLVDVEAEDKRARRFRLLGRGRKPTENVVFVR